MIARFVNALHGSMDVPAQYMATISLGLPLEFTSHFLNVVLTFGPMKEADAVLKARRRNTEPPIDIDNVDSKTDPCTGESKSCSTSSAAANSADTSLPFEPPASRPTRSHTHNAVGVDGDEEGRSGGADGAGDVEDGELSSAKEGGAKCSLREDAYANAAPEGGSRTDKDSNDHHAPASKSCKPAAAATRKKNRFVDDEAVDDGSDGGTCEGDGDGDLQVDDRGNIPGLVKGGGDEGEGGAGRGDDGTGEDGGAEDDDDEEDEAFSRRGSKRKNKMAVASDSDEDAGADGEVAAASRRRIVVSDSDDEDEEVDGGDGQEVVFAAGPGLGKRRRKTDEEGGGTAGGVAARTSGDDRTSDGDDDDSIDLNGGASSTDTNEDDGYAEATAGQPPKVASEGVEAGEGGTYTTDGAGSTVVVGPSEDYRHRDCNEEAGGGRTSLRLMSMVQFAMRMYKVKYTGTLDGADLGSRQHRLAPEHPQSERHILKERKEATRKKHVFVFIGPTRKPDEPDAFAQFVLLFFRPWRGVDGIRGLLIKSGENESGDEGDGVATHSSWEAALAAWSLADRQASDPLWYAREDGVFSHPYIDNMICMWEGEDRAREMAANLKAQTHAERMDLAAARGDLSDDEGYCQFESDADYLQSVNKNGGIQYLKKQERPGRLRNVDIDQIAVAAGVNKLTTTFANPTRLAGLPGVMRSPSLPPELPWTCAPTGRVSLTADFDSDEDAKAPSEASVAISPEASVTRGLQGSLKVLVEGFRGNDVERAGRAMSAQPEPSTTAIPQRSLPELLVDLGDLEPHTEAGRADGVDSSRGQFVPRSCLPADVRDECGLDADQFCGPTLIETIVRLTCNPRQAIVAFILGRAHAREGHTKDTGIANHFLLRGEPGTGKSRVAKTIIEWLELNASSETIAGGSFTGKAASNIGMCTLHRSVNMGVRDRQTKNGPSKRDKELATVYRPVRTYFHDECSLTPAALFWKVASKMNSLRDINAGQTFGNLRVVVRFFEVADTYTRSLSLYPRRHVHCTSSLHWSTPCAGCGWIQHRLLTQFASPIAPHPTLQQHIGDFYQKVRLLCAPIERTY